MEAFGDRLDKISLQKLLMLVSKQQLKPDFHFVPYKYGCYSFQAGADLQAMFKYNMVAREGDDWIKTDPESYLTNIKDRDRQVIRYAEQIYGGKTVDELIHISYVKYPYFAINSIVAKDILTKGEYDRVIEARPHCDRTMLFTIGYEGISLEEYINKLILNGVQVLCDVRKNSYSMKFGFSKSQLQTACNGVGIEFLHIPELGIDSDKRQSLDTQSDYDKLFLQYCRSTLPQVQGYLNKIIDLLIQHKSVALTCFESNINQCHRKHLADALVMHPLFAYELKHI